MRCSASSRTIAARRSRSAPAPSFCGARASAASPSSCRREGTALIAPTVNGVMQPGVRRSHQHPVRPGGASAGALVRRRHELARRGSLAGVGLQLGITIEHLRTSDDNVDDGRAARGARRRRAALRRTEAGGIALRLYAALMVTPTIEPRRQHRVRAGDVGTAVRRARLLPVSAPTPAELEIWNHRLAQVAEEMGVALARAAFSPNIKERRDYSCALFDAQRAAGRAGGAHPGAPRLDGAVGGGGARAADARRRRSCHRQRSVRRRHAPAGHHAGARRCSPPTARCSATWPIARTTPTSAASAPGSMPVGVHARGDALPEARGAAGGDVAALRDGAERVARDARRSPSTTRGCASRRRGSTTRWSRACARWRARPTSGAAIWRRSAPRSRSAAADCRRWRRRYGAETLAARGAGAHRLLARRSCAPRSPTSPTASTPSPIRSTTTAPAGTTSASACS